MINELFDWCVELLRDGAALTGMTYEEINILVFVVVHPLLTLALGAYAWALRKRLRAQTS